MLWIKAFHIIFVVSWFAGLFYLPRLFVYHCEITEGAHYDRFCTMERRLYVITTIGMIGTVVLGLWLWLGYLGMPGPAWLRVKFALALGLIAYHGWLWVLLRGFARQTNRHGARFYRLVNEIPTLFLIAMVILAVVKPFS